MGCKVRIMMTWEWEESERLAPNDKYIGHWGTGVLDMTIRMDGEVGSR
jgi:hypothetical protein